MVLISLIYVRRGAKEGETTILARLLDRVLPDRGGGAAPQAAPRLAQPDRLARGGDAGLGRRTVADAPAVQRRRPGRGRGAADRAITRAPGARASRRGQRPRAWLMPLVWIELAVILLVVTNTAATTLTREKESLTIELLLCDAADQPLHHRGNAPGAGPAGDSADRGADHHGGSVCRCWTCCPRAAAAVTTLEAVLLVPLQMVAFAALAAMIGLHFSLLSKKTVQAVMISTAIVMGAAGLLTACGLAMKGTNPTVAALVLPFTPVWGCRRVLDPWAVVKGAMTSSGAGGPTPDDLAVFRVTRIVSTLVASAIYLAITFALHNSMVRGFDMTVRRQTT